ncbi:MAG: toxin [Chloroflexota bacterium]|nr:MAG: toxin [Chloroflexota bacterium]
MKYFSWDTDKNKKLQNERGISFEEVVFYLEKGQLLDVIEHPNQERYSGQKMFIINIKDYAYLIPFVETEKEIFLKTIIPSRKATKKYLGDE